MALSQQPAPAAKGIYSSYTAHPLIPQDREENLFSNEKSVQTTSLGQREPLNAAWLNALCSVWGITAERNPCGGKTKREPHSS